MNKETKQKPTLAIALGFFDGVHLGHKALLDQVKHCSGDSMISAALTFDRHPATSLGKEDTKLLSTVSDRQWLLSKTHQISQVIVADFSAIQSMEWDSFVEDYLINQLHVAAIVVGHDFRFGRQGKGTPEKLEKLCRDLGISCHVVAPVKYDNIIVSSTHIRKLIAEGNMKLATEFLGHPHVLSNTVIHGNKIGKKVLGFPTVNLSIPEQVILPAFGVYACKVWIGDDVYQSVANVGIRPTVEEADKQVTVEGFLLNFPDCELYGQKLRVEFHHHLRGEQKFPNFQALSQQIARDVTNVENFFKGPQ